MSQSKTLIQLKKVYLQYPAAGEPGPHGIAVNSDAERWVDIDRASGGFPYSVPIGRAYDFQSTEKADDYNKSFGNVFLVREVMVTYEF